MIGVEKVRASVESLIEAHSGGPEEAGGNAYALDVKGYSVVVSISAAQLPPVPPKPVGPLPGGGG